MKKSLEERFKILDNTLKSEDFLANRGLGNEVGYYIFDYDPKHELLVREYIRNLEKRNSPEIDGFKIQVFNLYEIMMDFIEKKGYLDKIEKMEHLHDIMHVSTRINRLLKMEEFDDSQMYFTQ